MNNLDPLLMEALKAAMPKEAQAFSERGILQRKIESLIVELHPDGYEAAEILVALTESVKKRYDNQLVTEAKIDQYGEDLKAAFEKAYEAA